MVDMEEAQAPKPKRENDCTTCKYYQSPTLFEVMLLGVFQNCTGFKSAVCVAGRKIDVVSRRKKNSISNT